MILKLGLLEIFLLSMGLNVSALRSPQGGSNKISSLFQGDLNEFLSTTYLFSYSFGGQKSKMNITGLKAKSRCQQDWFLLEAPGENLFLANSNF